MRLAYERQPEIPGEQRQREGQQDPNQGQPANTIEDSHNGMYLLYYAEGALCVILDRAVFRSGRVFLLWPGKLRQGTRFAML